MVYTNSVWRFATVYVVTETGVTGELVCRSAVANASLRTGGSMEMSKDSQELHDELMALRKRIITEQGTEPACPYCGVARVSRSSYIRCNPCGKNWMHGQDYSKHPHAPTDTTASLFAEGTTAGAD